MTSYVAVKSFLQAVHWKIKNTNCGGFAVKGEMKVLPKIKGSQHMPQCGHCAGF